MLTRFDRLLAIAVSLTSLVGFTAWLGGPGLAGESLAEAPFQVPGVNVYLLFGSCALAGVLALAIACRRGLSPAAYSLAGGLAAWSSGIVGLMPPVLLPESAADLIVFITLFLIPWHAARFALHFPREMEIPAGLRRAVDSFAYPAVIAVLDAVSMAPPGPPALVEVVAGWAAILLGASMLGLALHWLVLQRRAAGAADRRRLRWIWAGACGAVLVLVPALGMFPLLNQPATMYIPFALAGLGPTWLIGCAFLAVFSSQAFDPAPRAAPGGVAS